MTASTRTRGWTALAVVTIVGVLLSLAGTARSGIVTCFNNSECGCTALNCSAPDQGGTCVNGSCQCNPGFAGLHCSPLGACCGVLIGATAPGQAAASAVPCEELTAADCDFFNGAYLGDGTTCGWNTCDPTATPSATATATPTATPVPQGGSCSDVSQCDPGLFCSDAVCCDSACTGPQQSCNQPGQPGICAAIVAPAPAASNGGLLLMIGILLAVGAAALALRARR